MTYIALLRGINVSGHKLIKMEELRKMFEGMGFKNVRTLIQSGNVIFEAAKTKPESLRKKIEAGLLKFLGYEVTVVIRTIEDLEKIVKEYPFSKIKGHGECKIYVGFIETVPEKTKAAELTKQSDENEMFRINGDNIYLLCRKSFMDSKMSKNIVDKTLKLKTTTRNWNTVNKLLTFK